MSDRPEDPSGMSDADPVRRAQIQMKRPLPKRFYRQVTTGPAEGGHGILLDGRPVRTPGRNLLVVPAPAIAERLRAEWEAQADAIDPARMPATRLVNTALDGVAANLDAVFAEIVGFAGTDLVCYRAHSPTGLVERQRAGWDPLLRWIEEASGAHFRLVEGVMHRKQPAEAVAAFSAALAPWRDPLALACLHTVTTLTGSALIALALAEGVVDADRAWALAHIDEDWQIEQWGGDEEAARRRALRREEMDVAAAVLAEIPR